MPEVFDEAALRHYHDAELLIEQSRLANADQLYGFAAECAIKLAWSSRNSECPHTHINELWDKIPLQKLQKLYPALLSILKQPNPFVNWSVSQRYESDQIVNVQTVEGHRKSAKRILGCVGLIGGRQTS